MKRNVLCITLSLLLVALSGCNKVKSDAKKAAKYTNESIMYSTEMELERAAESYQKTQQLFDKYKNDKDSAVFLQLYREYRDDREALK